MWKMYKQNEKNRWKAKIIDMNVIAAYVITKEKLSRELADKVVELYMSGTSYKDAIKKVKEIYNLNP